MAGFERVSLPIVLIASIWVACITGYTQERQPDVNYVPTPEEAVIEMLKMAKVNPNDIVYDLGCGDGRIVITAAKVFGARGVGVDIDPVRIKESNENARKAGVTNRVTFLEQDLFETDISKATVVTLYLSPDLNLRLRPKLFRELGPGTRIVSHEFDMDDWKPDNTGTVPNVKLYYKPNPTVKDTRYYYWVIPADVAGTWHWTLLTPTGIHDYRLRLDQHFQEISGHVNVKGQEIPIGNARLIGDQLSFTFREKTNQQNAVMLLDGRVDMDTIQGNAEVRGGPLKGSYPWAAKRTYLSLSQPIVLGSFDIRYGR